MVLYCYSFAIVSCSSTKNNTRSSIAINQKSNFTTASTTITTTADTTTLAL